jgi:putative membrane protein
MPRKLTENDKERVELAISELESRTSAELAVVVAGRSHDYAVYPFLWAAGLALVTGGAVAVAWPNATGLAIVLLEGAVFIAAYLAHFTPLGLLLVPAAVKHDHADRLARAEFAALVEGRTEGRLGALLFVALAERQIAILADRGIRERIPPERWQAVIDHFTSAAKTRPVADALLAAMEDCAVLLAEPFPPGPHPRDEIPNRVTEV